MTARCFEERPAAGNTALVTGAGRGIGRSIVLTLAAVGMKVVGCARSRNELEAVARETQDLATPVTVLPCDLSEPVEIDALFTALRLRLPRLDLLVNNAGVGCFGPSEEVSLEDWDRVMDVNARGTFRCAQQAFAWMKEIGGGQIINISSVVGLKGYANQVAYAASKHAIMGLTKVLAREGQAHGIRVNAICPGGVATDLVRQARPDLPHRSLIQPGDVARAVLYLVTEPATCCTDMIELRRRDSTPFA